MTFGNSKNTKVESAAFHVDKNVIYYGNSAINTNNISLISISPIPANNTWIIAVVLGIIGIWAIKKWGVILVLIAIVWCAIVIYYNKNRGDYLALSLNSGNTLYFHCREKYFLNNVVTLMVKCIKSGTGYYTVNFEKCIINQDNGIIENAEMKI